MKPGDADLAPSNPFSTRFVRPGTIEYLFEAGVCAKDLVQGLAGSRWRGQIVGPHGSGKSTLLATMLEALRQSGRWACVFRLQQGDSRLTGGWLETARSQNANLIVVEGYERMTWWHRRMLEVRTRRMGWGLLVTAHRDMGLPTLIQTKSSLAIAEAVVERVLSASGETIEPEVVSRYFSQCEGNLRETLFALYDLYEARHASGQNSNVQRTGSSDCAA